MNRRVFLTGLASKAGQRIDGAFVNDAFPLGHRLRDRQPFAAPKQQRKVPLVIVGGGIGGLCAAWRCVKSGFRDFVVLEMERDAGGNSRWGENDVSRFPWAAHYLPVPNRKTVLVREMLTEFGLLDAAGEFDERHLCHSPQERLYLHGRWQDGFEPHVGAIPRDLEQYQRFEAKIEEFRVSGQFTIPIDDGARPSVLDRLSMTEWMRQNGFDSEYLNWYVDYSCRDDYGALASDTSAWAGIHYHAAREHEEKGPLTWPEGNGWLVQKILERVGRHVVTGAAVYHVAKDKSGWRVLTESVEYRAEAVIFAAPTFLAAWVIEGMPRCSFVYSPWLTANLTLDHLPRGRGGEPAWDNVIYRSPSLGYVDATHQSLASHHERAVWTYYWALARGTPAGNRDLLLAKDWNWWKEQILGDLERAHPDIRECVSRLDIMRLGHAMVRPAPGFLGSEDRRRWANHAADRLWFANADLSGISIFEEAQYRGDRAARAALRALGR